MKARIGITSFVDCSKAGSRFVAVNENYSRSVAAAGALPLIIPMLSGDENVHSCLESLDGIVFSGGSDVVPMHFGEDSLPGQGKTCGARDEWEMALALAAREEGIPMLGICRGHQLLNVAFGGDLYQDLERQLPGALGHCPPEGLPMDELRHTISIVDSDSKLAKALGAGKHQVNSFHHQGVRRLATGLVETAHAADGLVEGYEGAGGSFIMGVQFHPEALSARYPEFLGIFRELVAACQR